MNAQPDYSAFLATTQPESTALALREVKRALPDARLIDEVSPGVLLIEGDFAALAAVWQSAPPIFVRHACPAGIQIPLAGTIKRDLPDVRTALQLLLERLDAARAFSVQTRILAADLPYSPFDFNTPLAEWITAQTGARLDVRQPDQIISLVVIKREKQPPPALTVCIGLSTARENLSDWAGGMRRFARDPGQISRAEFKLLEALEWFRIQPPARGVALDLGAAPGGWTRVLRGFGLYVTAVDPAALDPRLKEDRGVRHLRMSAEAFLEGRPADQFDMIVNDMRLDAPASARLMVRCAPLLRRSGFGLMTVKLRDEPQKDESAFLGAFDILRAGYRLLGARQFFHNRSEITLALASADR